MNWWGVVLAFSGAFAAEYWHDRLLIHHTQLTTGNIPPWTREETMRKRVRRALWKTLWLSLLQWFDLAGIVKWHLPIFAIAAGGITGSLWATREGMWEDWRIARARYLGPTMLGSARGKKKGSDVEQSVESDPHQTNLLEEE